MKVNSRKALSRLSLRSLLASKKQNVITVLAIVLTTILFTTLFTTFFGLRNTLQLVAMKEMGDSSYASVAIDDEDTVGELNAIPGVRAGLQIYAGGTPNDIGVYYCDSIGAEYLFSSPVEGRLPEASDEIVISKAELASLGTQAAVGEQIELEIEIPTDSGPAYITDTFTVSGISSDDSKYILVSRAFIEESGSSAKEAVFALIDLEVRSQVRAYSVAEQIGLSADDVFINPVFTAESDPLGAEGYAALVVLMLLIFFTGFLIIYNIFQITVGNKIRDYGILKTIGITSRQIRKIIRKQSMILCIAGVPVGLVAGYLIGVSMIPILLAQTAYKNIEPVSGFNILVFIGAAAVSILTVFISSSVPGRKASKVSPIEALRYSEVKVNTGKRDKVNASIPSMAFANLGRNKLRTFLVVLSISLAIVLFNTLCVFVDNLDINSFIQSYSTAMDFTVSTPSYFMGDRDSLLSSAEIDEIASHISSDHFGSAYEPSRDCLYADADIDYTVQAVAVDEELFSEVNVIEGDISPMYDAGTDYVIATGESSLHVGDTVRITCCTEFQYKVNGVTYDSVYDIPDDVSFENIEYVVNGEETEYTVCAVIDQYPSSYDPNFMYGGRTMQLLLREEQLDDLTDGEYSIMCYCADAKNSQAAEEAEAYLHDLTQDSGRVEYRSLETVREEFKQFTDAVKYIGGFLCVIVGSIAVLNFVNAILTGILSRKRELALLKAVGMTGKQLKKMLGVEGLSYSFLAIIFSIPATVMLNLLFLKLELFWSASTFHITILPILVLLPILALIGIMIPSVIYGKVKGDSIVDDLRTNE